MAAVTETAGTRREIIAGSMRAVKADLTSVANTNTWVPGLAIIEYVSWTTSTAAAATQVGATWTSPATKQGVVTFAVESGTLAGTAMAWGF